MKSCAKAASVTVLLLSITAHAEPTKRDAAAAAALFYEARALMAKGRHAEACPKLEESLRLDAGLGTQFNLADCNEHVGKLATAWAGFVDVASAAKASGQAAREKIAQKRADALGARLPRIAIDVPSPEAGLAIARDGVAVGPASFGAAIPVDPGPHVIRATAPGKTPWETTLTAAEGKTTRASIPPLAAAGLASAPVPLPTLAAPVTAEQPGAPVETTSAAANGEVIGFPEPVDERRGSAQRTAGYVLGAVGVAGLAGAAGFGLRSLGKRDDSRDHCRGDVCDATGVALRDDAIRAGNVATGATVAGGIALAGGILLVVTAPRGGSTVSASPVLGPDGGGIRVGGSFR